jgi:hypothetical protein
VTARTSTGPRRPTPTPASSCRSRQPRQPDQRQPEADRSADRPGCAAASGT